MKYHKLLQATVKGTIWNSLTFFTGKGFAFITTVILARLLFPDDFGLMALSLVFINYLMKLQSLGIGEALIYRQGTLKDLENTAFFLSLTMAVFLSSSTYFLSPVISSFFKEPRVIPVIQVLSLWFILNGLGSVQESILRKDLDFRRRSIPEMVRGIVKGAVSILLAVLGFGVWSLVWGQMAGTLVKTLLYFYLCHWKPRFSFNFNTAKLLLQYGLPSSVFSILYSLYRNVDYLILGRRVATAQLGFYDLAFRLPDIAISGIQEVIAPVIFPVYMKLQHDMDALRRGVILTIQYVALFCLPAGLGIYLVSPEFVEVFYTDRWMSIVPVMKALAIYSMLNAMSAISDHVYRATGKLATANRMSVIRLTIAVAVLWATAGYGITAVAIGQIGIAACNAGLNTLFVKRIIKLKLSTLLAAIQPAVTSTAVMTAGILMLGRMLETYSPTIRFILFVGVGALLYISMLWLFYRDLFRQTLTILSSGKQ